MENVQTVLNIYKPIGTTPLQLIHDLRKEQPEYADQKIGYAGRLDPLAHGVMLLMIGEATKHRDQFLGLEKNYTFHVLFGVETDTYDVLGLMTKIQEIEKIIVNEKVNLFVSSHIGKQQQSYPPFSSKTVDGKPLFWWARENRLSEIQIPQRTIEIKDFSVVSFQEIEKQKLQKIISTNLSLIIGDFRQKEITAQWDNFFFSTQKKTFQTATFQVNCSSGTYVRGLVHELGKYLESGAIALDILRTSVGEFNIDNSLKLKLSHNP